MKPFSLFSESQINEWILDLKQLIDHLLTQRIFDQKLLLTEDEVSSLLGVSERTMRTYRTKKYFHHIKLEGRILYLELILFIDLIIISLESLL
ncbi:helix-turn-helix domain-containing protein [Epilithonimonas tenax]|uniref:helix-turn-helix domain-containing protein n=1 Tax=Epilithonimonas tenax TaxID=191577 RepID=UPI00040BDD6B|nr:helix-turn-helix domain-containing protein [Epilithonimonas tenax]